jgi:hypothetical protein
MRQQAYQDDLGATAACTRRLCEASSHAGVKFPSRKHAAIHDRPEAFIGDSWFIGVRVAEWAASHGHSYFGALKTSTKYTPYQELIDKMDAYPSGSNLVMECTTPNGNKLICLGYKYSARKVLVFLGTKSSGFTKPGEPYIARFPDCQGNVAQRSVPRPDVVSRYFNDSNVADSHNQSRQFELALEKRWVTHACWFWLATTLIGMTVTDCWRAYKFAMPNKNSKEITIKEFADRMAHDCTYNSHSSDASFNGYLPVTTEAGVPQSVHAGLQDDVSTMTATTSDPIDLASIMAQHPFKDNPELEEHDGKMRSKRRRCSGACTVEGRRKLTTKTCFHPRCQARSQVVVLWQMGVWYLLLS